MNSQTFSSIILLDGYGFQQFIQEVPLRLRMLIVVNCLFKEQNKN